MSKELAEKNAKKYLDIRQHIYPEITDEFENIESSELVNTKDVRIIRFVDKIQKTIKVLKTIDTSEFNLIVNEDTIETIEYNINSMYDNLLYIQKRLLAYEYADDLQSPIRQYLKNIVGDSSNFRRWAKDEDDLANKFISMLTHPDNIETYKNQIKRMILGTMSLKEFKKIYDTTKHKMIALPKFQSLIDYKNNKAREIKYKP
jgi:hypothetical protein